MKNGKLNNDRYMSMLAEFESVRTPLDQPVPEMVRHQVKEMIRDWRSLPSNHPFYAAGMNLEGSVAAWAAWHYGLIQETDDAAFFGAPIPTNSELI